MGNIQHSRALYLGGAMSKRALGIAFAGLAILTLAPEDVSRFGLLTSGLVIIASLGTANATWGLERLAFTDPPGAARDRWHGACLRLMALGMLAITPLALLLTAAIGDPLRVADPWNALGYATAALATAALLFVSAWQRIEDRLAQGAILAIAQGGITLGVYLMGWALGHGGFALVLIALLLGLVVPLLPALPTMIRLAGLPGDRERVRRLLRFSAPTILHGLGCWGLLMAPRWCGAGTIGLEGIAGFTVVSQIYGTCTLISRASLETRTASLGDAFAQNDLAGAREVLDRGLVRLIAGIIGLHLLVLLAVLVAGDLLPEHARPGPVALAWSAVIALLDAVVTTRERWLFGRERTSALSIASLLAAGVAIGIGTLSTRFGGGIDALFAATALGFAIQAAAAVWLAGRDGYHRRP